MRLSAIPLPVVNVLLGEIDKKIHQWQDSEAVEGAHNLSKISRQGKICVCLNISSSISDSMFTRNHNMLDYGRACITTREKK